MNNPGIMNREMPLMAAMFTSLLCISFGSNAIALKISMEGFGPLTTAGFRFALSSLLILIWAGATGKPVKLKKEQVPEIGILAAAFFVQLSGYHIGMYYTYASRATIIINAQPFLVLLLAHFFIPGDKITLRKLTGILLGFGGVLFLFLHKITDSGNLLLGDLIILGATFIWASVSIFTKRIIHRYHPFQMVFYPMLLSFPLYFVAGYFLENPMIKDVNIKIISSLFYQGLVAGAFGFVAWNTMLQKYGAVSLHSYLFLSPIAGVAFGGLILGEPMTSQIIIPLILIVSGILIVNFRIKQAPDEETGYENV
jgi:drug/metabolite transporter (DMT)-like permease